jgi:hypothetical protein
MRHRLGTALRHLADRLDPPDWHGQITLALKPGGEYDRIMTTLLKRSI